MAQMIKLPPGAGWYYGWSCTPWSDLYWVDCTQKEWKYYHPWYPNGQLELSPVALREGEVIVEWAGILREGDPPVNWSRFIKA